MISTQTLGANLREYEDELISSMALLLVNCKYGDVILSIDGIELQAHKVILSVRSPVFDAMFGHQDTKEAQESKVEIVDVPKDTFKDLLQFIYTGKVPAKERLTTELLAAADKVSFRFVGYKPNSDVPPFPSTKWTVSSPPAKSICPIH